MNLTLVSVNSPIFTVIIIRIKFLIPGLNEFNIGILVNFLACLHFLSRLLKFFMFHPFAKVLVIESTFSGLYVELSAPLLESFTNRICTCQYLSSFVATYYGTQGWRLTSTGESFLTHACRAKQWFLLQHLKSLECGLWGFSIANSLIHNS